MLMRKRLEQHQLEVGPGTFLDDLHNFHAAFRGGIGFREGHEHLSLTAQCFAAAHPFTEHIEVDWLFPAGYFRKLLVLPFRSHPFFRGMRNGFCDRNHEIQLACIFRVYVFGASGACCEKVGRAVFPQGFGRTGEPNVCFLL